MKLSAPLYRLRQNAKILAREQSIALNIAQTRLAKAEGFNSWSLLIAKAATNRPARDLLAELAPGDLVLLGARPGHGKTLLGLELIVETIKAGGHGAFFTLEYTAADLLKLLRVNDTDPAALSDRFDLETSDDISARLITERLADAHPGTVAVIDYLQLLDQKRENPDLMTQIRALKTFARARQIILVFLSQIDRSYDTEKAPCPGLEDVRLPNPLDLTLFGKTCFLHDGEIRIGVAA